MYRVVVFLLPMALLCTTPPPLDKETLPNVISAFAPVDSLCLFKAFGDIRFSLQGERLSAKIDVVWRSDSNFTIAINSRWGASLALITADSSGAWKISAGDSLYKKRPEERVALDGILDYSLTWKEFLRIATGRIVGMTPLLEPSDSLLLKGKRAFVYWHEDSTKGRPFAITAIVDRKHFSITDVIYRRNDPPHWQLSISSIRRGVPEEIRFEDQNNNYFYLDYETVIVGRGIHCRTERL